MYRYLSASFALLVICSDAQADPCDAALVQDTYKEGNKLHDDYRLSLLVTADNFDEIKQGFKGKAVIYGIPMESDFNNFKQHRDAKFQSQNETRTIDEARSIAWTGFGSIAGKAYKDCLDAQVLKEDGLKAAVLFADDEKITILVKWFVPGGAKTANVKWVPEGLGLNVTKAIPQGRTTISVPRPTERLAFAGNFAGYTTGPIVLEPKVRSLAIPPPPTTREKAIRLESDASQTTAFTIFPNKTAVLHLNAQLSVSTNIPTGSSRVRIIWGPYDAVQKRFVDGAHDSEVTLSAGNHPRIQDITDSIAYLPTPQIEQMFLGVAINSCWADQNTNRREANDASRCFLEGTVSFEQ